MIIDFHTHVFPDKIAAKTISLLAEKGKLTPFSDGTVDGLVEKMTEAGIDISVTLPVLTNPGQFDSVNRYAAEINSAFADKKRRLISFAGIHPKCENIEEKMAFIKQKGFLGVKIHPEYQDAFINDEGYVRIMQAAKENDLIVVTHSGVDAAYRDSEIRCTPERVKDLINKVPHSKLVLAHYGANEAASEVLDSLCGLDVYFDTALVLGYIDKDSFLSILKKHGEDRILFASDSPWGNIKEGVEFIRSLSLDKNTEEKLFYKNATALLGI